MSKHAITTTEDYRPYQWKNWLVADGILRVQHDRRYLFGLSWDAVAVYVPDCGCRCIIVTLCLVPTITFTYERYVDGPECAEAKRNREWAKNDA